jgi:hypothetical protein
MHARVGSPHQYVVLPLSFTLYLHCRTLLPALHCVLQTFAASESKLRHIVDTFTLV